MNATWPLALLTATRSELVLKVSLVGTYIFKPEQVRKIEPYGLIPYFGKGVRISHEVEGYPEKIVFWCLCADPRPLVNQLMQLGYGA